MVGNRFIYAIVVLLACSFFTTVAFAGAPLIVDEVTGKAWAYQQGSVVPVYYDNGNYAVVYDWANYPNQVTFDNSVGRHAVEKGYHDWSSVPTTSFRAKVIGNFASIGLPDINGDNAAQVIGAYNGGGIHVIFDADGSVMENFFGVGSNVLGISSPEWGENGVITESWTVLNGQAIDAADTPNAAQYQGVATHEFGHSIGLAHTQTNGAAAFYGDPVGPASCGGNLPYASNLTVDDIETMYPFSYPVPPNGTGLAQANIHTLDDTAAISDLYPGPGWPNSYGTISGKVLDLDGKTQLTGVNVIARNLSDPYAGANSSLSGQWTQGQFGPDGSFVLHGLKPGAQYALYVDAVYAGGYSTPPMWFLPGAEKFYNGPINGKNQVVDPCQYQPITAMAGKVSKADIKFDRIKNAPVIFNLGYGTGVTDISGDGSIVVGNYGRGGPVFRWTEKSGLLAMDAISTGDITFISRNGDYITSDLLSADGNTNLGAYRYDARNGWFKIPGVGFCGTDSNYTHGVANDGSVFGLAYRDCNDYKTFKWTPRRGTVLFPAALKKDDGTPANGRPNRISADGSVIAGWEELDWGGRAGVIWVNGRPSVVTNKSGEAVSEALTVSSDGSTISGMLFDGQTPAGYGWIKDVDSTRLRYFEPLSQDATPAKAFAISGDGKVMAGLSGDPWFSFSPAPFIWTKQMGTANLDEFVKRQGTSIEQYTSLWTPMAMSDDGTVLGGWGVGAQYYAGWILQIKKVFVCHATPGRSGDGRTLSVAFPKDFDEHLEHGDTVGPCQDDQQ